MTHDLHETTPHSQHVTSTTPEVSDEQFTQLLNLLEIKDGSYVAEVDEVEEHSTEEPVVH